jgi:hypothetical protein
MNDTATHAPPGAARHGHEPPPTACPNCATPFERTVAAPRYCPHCGQQTTLHPPSVAEFVHEFVGHYVAFEGPLWKTLRLLLLRPGQLTREYLAGRRRRYVLPLRLYLSASFLFFLAFKFMSHYTGPTFVNVSISAVAPHAASAPASGSGDEERTVVISPQGVQVASGPEGEALKQRALARQAREGACGASNPCGWFTRKAEEASRRWVADPQGQRAAFVAHSFGVAPYALFLMLPVFAALVALAYRNRRMLFGEHLVFSMHMHSFWFLVGLVAVLLPGAVLPWMLLATLAYGLVAMRTVYGGRWKATFARAVAILSAYTILLGFASAGLSMALFLD